MSTQTESRDSETSAGIGGKDLPVLYVEPGCPWCVEVVDFLDEHGIPYRRIDISQDPGARSEMERITRQDKVPAMDWNGEVLADLGVEELVPFLRSKNIELEDS